MDERRSRGKSDSRALRLFLLTDNALLNQLCEKIKPGNATIERFGLTSRLPLNYECGNRKVGLPLSSEKTVTYFMGSRISCFKL